MNIYQMLWGEFLRTVFLSGWLLLCCLSAMGQTAQVTLTPDKAHYGHGESANITVSVHNPASPSTKATPLTCTATLSYTYADLGAQSTTATCLISVGSDKDNRMHNVSLSLSLPGVATPVKATFPDIEGGDTAVQNVILPMP